MEEGGGASSGEEWDKRREKRGDKTKIFKKRRQHGLRSPNVNEKKSRGIGGK